MYRALKAAIEWGYVKLGCARHSKNSKKLAGEGCIIFFLCYNVKTYIRFERLRRENGR
jgi:hypothetical protein